MFDWWSKFYASIDDQERSGEYLKKGYDTLAVNRGPQNDKLYSAQVHICSGSDLRLESTSNTSICTLMAVADHTEVATDPSGAVRVRLHGVMLKDTSMHI